MSRRGDLNGWWRFGIVVVGFCWRILFRFRVRGAERVPALGKAIVAPNHVSALDGVALALATGSHARRMTRFLVAAEFFEKPSVAWGLRLYRQIPLRRGENDRAALGEATSAIDEGAVAGIFPEGTVNVDPDGGVQRGRRGVARIALATRAPVVPVGIWGTQNRWPKTGLRLRRPWRPAVAIVYGEPIEARGDAASAVDVQEVTELVMGAIAKQVDEARTLAEGGLRP